jgi:hypothetical protein
MAFTRLSLQQEDPCDPRSQLPPFRGTVQNMMPKNKMSISREYLCDGLAFASSACSVTIDDTRLLPPSIMQGHIDLRGYESTKRSVLNSRMGKKAGGRVRVAGRLAMADGLYLEGGLLL